MRRLIILPLIVTSCTVCVPSIHAGVASKAIQEAAELAAKKFGREVAEEGLETMAAKMSRLAAKHGDDVVAAAFSKVGPRAASVVSEAGEHGGLALRLLARHGDSAIVLTVSKKSLGQVARFGDDAAAALLRHGTVGAKLIDDFGIEGAQALARITPQNGRRLAMMAAEGGLRPDLVGVVAKHGDQACDFIWRNKGALTVATSLAAFVATPEEFLNGTRALAEVAADAAIKPLASVPGVVAGEAAKRVNWDLVTLLFAILAGIVVSRWAKFATNVARAAEWWSSRRRQYKEAKNDA